MAETLQDEATKTCKCLNMRIRPQLGLAKPPDFLITTGDSEYTLTYVGEQGIIVAHPQLTMRTRKMGPAIADSSRCIRFTTLTCLLCQTLVYRVQQVVTVDIDGQEGPLLPSLDWVEQETLKSSCGWIEVHKSCLVLDDATPLSSAYSPTFQVVVPPSPVEATKTTAQSAPEAFQDMSSTNDPVGQFLDSLKPLFPPVPFVPSHPVFSHLSSVAVRESQSLRSAAEAYLAVVVRNKLEELEKAEDKLRRDVEELWRKFAENMGQVENEVTAVGEKKRRDSVRGLTLNTSGISGTPLVSIKNFVPVATPVARATSPASPSPRLSSLSASLATSMFHHPRMRPQERPVLERSTSDSPRSPPPYSSHPSSLGSVDSDSLSTESLPGLSPRVNGESIIQPFKRSMDESRDTAASFRYFTILEADVARARQQEPTSNAAIDDVARKSGESAKVSGDSKRAQVPSGAEKQDKENDEAKEDRSKKSNRDNKALEGTPRGRRKVKFDIKSEPLVTDGERVDKNGRRPSSSRKDGDGEEMIFDLEDGSSEPESSDAAPALPFIDNVQLRRARQRAASHTGLPASLSSLRPASLPVYSPLRLRVGEAGAPKPKRRSHTGSSHPTSPSTPPEARTEYPEPLDPHEEEILKLVAADTPSHRGAWKRNSKAWQLFVTRHNGRAPDLIPEENEDGSGNTTNDTDDSDWDAPHETRWSHGHPASLPISIGPLPRRREPLSLASYQPKSSLQERAGSTTRSQQAAGRHASSASLRRASYAERDRSRLMDPGALDFATEDDENGDESENEEEPGKADLLDEGRGRQRALKILEAQRKVPAAGIYDKNFRGYATVTAQGEGIHVWDLDSIHSVASHSVGEHVTFSAPAFSRCVVEDRARLAVSYAVIRQAPDVSMADCERTIWIMKQSLSGLQQKANKRKTVVVPQPIVRIYGVDSESLPLLLVARNGNLYLTNADAEIKSQQSWPGEREVLEAFVFPSKSCSFIQNSTDPSSSIVVLCCQAGETLYVRIVSVAEGIVHIGASELRIDEEGEKSNSRILGLTCSASGILSYLNSTGVWTTHQLHCANSTSLSTSIVAEPLHLRRVTAFKNKKWTIGTGIFTVSLGSSLVLLAALVDGKENISIQLWDLCYGVLLASQSMPVPSSLPAPRLALTVADEGQVLLTLSPSQQHSKTTGSSPRSLIHVIPMSVSLKSNIAGALGKAAATAEWLIPKTSKIGTHAIDDKRANLVATIQSSLKKKKPQRADEVFFRWLKQHTTSEPVLGHEFVKKIVNAVLPPEPPADLQYSPRIMQYLLENGLVSGAMLNGKVLSTLRDRGDWQNVMLAFSSVVDISEEEMMSLAKFIIDRQRQRESSDAMEVDFSEPWIPPLGTYLSACVSYQFTPSAMRLAIRKHLSDAQDLVSILEVLETWIHGGTEEYMESLLKSVVTNTDGQPSSLSSPPYNKVIVFLQALLDASYVALLQYQPSHEPLKRILSEIEPEIAYIDRMEKLRGALEPFTKVHVRSLREKAGNVPKETAAERKKRRKQLAQQASLGVGLYRLEELVL
ncbi:hypothetical protein F5I97DRAFT_1941864 [Phlebopus sp. FC_14]|nr:hypothetical protein F5I97DRAFT_1941864 [Phlebopus sp. FC_14]